MAARLLVLVLMMACGSNADNDYDGFTKSDGDCDDEDASVNPSMIEIMGDGIDNNCDGITECFQDSDFDGYGGDVIKAGSPNCTQLGESTSSLDCNDADVTEYPGVVWYADADEDGFGDAESSSACDRGAATDVLDGTDCDDTTAARNPSQIEVCDGLDNDCNSIADDGLPKTTYYPDSDGDQYGADAPVEDCADSRPGHVTIGGDCDDTSILVNPGQRELCDGVDHDCDSVARPVGLATFFPASGQTAVDFTNQFGSPDSLIPISEPGELQLCEGNFRGTIDVVAGPVTVRGQGFYTRLIEAAPNAGHVVMQADGEVHDLTMRGTGQGLYVGEGATVTASGLTFVNLDQWDIHAAGTVVASDLDSTGNNFRSLRVSEPSGSLVVENSVFRNGTDWVYARPGTSFQANNVYVEFYRPTAQSGFALIEGDQFEVEFSEFNMVSGKMFNMNNADFALSNSLVYNGGTVFAGVADTLTIQNSTEIGFNNRSGNILVMGSLDIDGSSFIGNAAPLSLRIDEEATASQIVDSRFEFNAVLSGAGALTVEGAGDLAVRSSMFLWNEGSSSGAIMSELANLELVDTTFESNIGDVAGGLYVVGGTTTIESATFTGDTPNSIYTEQGMSYVDSTVSDWTCTAVDCQ